MKTRQELILDFMLALAPNAYEWETEFCGRSTYELKDVSYRIYDHAKSLADLYLEISL